MKSGLIPDLQGNSIYFFGAIHNSCKPSVKYRYSCFTTSSGGRCPPHSPPAREITSPLTPECRLRRFFIIYLKVNAVAFTLKRAGEIRSSQTCGTAFREESCCTSVNKYSLSRPHCAFVPNQVQAAHNSRRKFQL